MKLTFDSVDQSNLKDITKYPDTCYNCDNTLIRRPKDENGSVSYTEMDKLTDWTIYNYVAHGLVHDKSGTLLGKLCDDCVILRQKNKGLTDDFTKQDLLNQEINPQKPETKDSKQVYINLFGHKTFDSEDSFGTKYKKSYVPDNDKKQVWITKYLGE